MADHQESLHFAREWPLWYEPVIAGLVCGLLCALLGLYMLLKRIVFVSLAITQSAGLGIFISFFIAGFWGLSLEHSPLSFLAGLILASSTAFLFVFFRKSQKNFDEVLIGLIYIAASGLIIFIGDRITEGKHAIDNLLFGNAVAVTAASLQILTAITMVTMIVHFFFRRELLYTSADSHFMHVTGLKTNFWLVLLYLTLIIGITISMKTLGTLPVFALMVIPPFIALKRAQGLRDAFLIAFQLGMIIPPLGYYLSFLFSFPTGASVIVVALLYVMVSFVEPAILREKRC